MESNHDLEIDARGESFVEALLHPDQYPARSKDSVSDINHGLASLSTTASLQATGNSESPNKIAAEYEYSEYINLMPLNLQYDYFEVLIICAPPDEDGAEDFKRYLQDLGYRVQILEIGTMESDKVEQAYQKALFFFLYVTKEFCKSTHALYHSHLFLSETLNDDNKKWSVVPVHTTMDRNEIKLDILLRNLHPIKYHRKDKDENNIKKLLTGKKREIAEREMKLHEDRETYFKANKSMLHKLKMFSPSQTQTLKEEEHDKRLGNCFSNLNSKINTTGNTKMEVPIRECTSHDTLVKKNVGIYDDTIIKSTCYSNYDSTKAITENEITDMPGAHLKSKAGLGNIYNDVQIDGPASQSQNIKSPTMTASSSSSKSPNIIPTTQTEVLKQAENAKHETHIHYHNDIKVGHVTNLLIGDGGSISTQHTNEDSNPANSDVLDVLKINREAENGLNSGSVSHRSPPDGTDSNPNPGKVFIGVFWDLQNCAVPKGKSAADIIKLIREKFILVDSNNEEKCFFCITDVTKEHDKTLKAINNNGVDLIHICSDKDNSSDFKIIQKMEDFSRDIGVSRAKVILITSDVDFGIKLADLKKRRYHIILIHKQNIKAELLYSVDENLSYEDLIKELPDKHEILLENEPFLIVHGYKQLSGEKAKNFINILESFFSQWKGKVVNQRGTKFGVLKFDSFELAKSAKEKTNGKDPFGEKNEILVCFLEGAPDEIKKSVEKILKQNPSKSKIGGKTQSSDRSLTPPTSGRIGEIQDIGSD